jgi:ATP-dependent DNA helicase DinG
MSDYLSDVFGDGGIFASRFPGYEARPGQVALARMVDEAMSSGRHALGEGPCGTGKGVAYCVPAIHQAVKHGKRVVIATANIALQEQLVTKDLPMLKELLPWDFEFALLKGRNNFVCLDRLREAEARGELTMGYGDEVEQQLQHILGWERETETGDKSELPFVPKVQAWSKASVGSEECKRDGCRFFDDCYAERAKAIAAEADIVVTNFHMLFAHLAIRGETGRDLVLPPFDFLVLDEAHEAADVAREFFGFTISRFTITRLAQVAAEAGWRPIARKLRDAVDPLFRDIVAFERSASYRKRLRTPGFVDEEPIVGLLQTLAGVAADRVDDSGRSREEQNTARNIARLSMLAASRITEAIAQSDGNKVYWIELDTKGRAKLRAKPIDVSKRLREDLFDTTDSVSLVSATLTTGGHFKFCRAEVGVPDEALEVIAESPFDFSTQSLLVVPDNIPEPKDPGFPSAVSWALEQVIDACDGRTLGLFTSYRVLNAVYDQVRHYGHRVLRQGDLPRTELSRIFKEDVGSVLLGTESFWTGIDVKGEALTAVVIDKLPFPHPDDPVISAICERDPRAFNNYLLPKAIISFRQGVGRLIRSRDDIGVIVLMDRRIAEKNYGRRFLASLPWMQSSRRLDSIVRFLGEQPSTSASGRSAQGGSSS